MGSLPKAEGRTKEKEVHGIRKSSRIIEDGTNTDSKRMK
jgi:hypothetical protein